jgi:nucleoside 2-deoxyribosyltransferase
MVPLKDEDLATRVDGLKVELDAAKEIIKRQQSEIATHIADIMELRSELRQADGRTIEKHTVEDLARVWTLVQRGNANEACYQLERVLSSVDSGWRTLS